MHLRLKVMEKVKEAKETASSNEVERHFPEKHLASFGLWVHAKKENHVPTIIPSRLSIADPVVKVQQPQKPQTQRKSKITSLDYLLAVWSTFCHQPPIPPALTDQALIIGH